MGNATCCHGSKGNDDGAFAEATGPDVDQPRAFEWRVFLPHTSANASRVDHILSAVSKNNVKLEDPRTDKYFVVPTAGVGVKLAERDGKLSSEIKKLSRCLAHITAPFAHRLLPDV